MIYDYFMLQIIHYLSLMYKTCILQINVEQK